MRSEERRCVLVVVGCDVHARKHFLAIEDGFRESAANWKALLLTLTDRGLDAAKLAAGDGALGFWAALRRGVPTDTSAALLCAEDDQRARQAAEEQHGSAKSALHEICQADSRATAEKAFDRLIATYEAKYPKAVGCLVKDCALSLAFHDFPAAHWQHVRTTNSIEATFATIRLRTRETRNCAGAKSGLRTRASARDERAGAIAADMRLPAARRRHCRREVYRWN
jgi:transposase-like protein